MALEYTLMIDDVRSLTEITNLLSHLQDFQYQLDYLKAPGLTIYIDDTDQEDKAFVKEHFHFTPSLCLCFIQDKFADSHLAYTNLIKATVALLISCKNAILDFNGDTILLRKINGQLLIYQQQSDFWEPSLLHLVSLPYQFALTADKEDSEAAPDFYRHERFFRTDIFILNPRWLNLSNPLRLRKKRAWMR